MSDQKLEEGDLFENARAKWIREHFPLYEGIWSRYVGCDGKSHPLEMKGLDEKSANERRLFFQSHYSLALFSHLLDDHANESIAGLQASVEAATHRTIDAYLRDTRNFTLFVTLVGQICDMVEQIAAALHDDDIRKKIVGFAKERSHAIHAARIPMEHDAYGVKIAAIAKSVPEEGEWDKGIAWDMVDLSKFKYLEDWMRDTRDGLFEVLRQVVFPMILKAAEKTFPRTVSRPKPESFSGMTTLVRRVSSTDGEAQPKSRHRSSGQFGG